MKFHLDVEEQTNVYSKKMLLNTLFYGPSGSGKHTLAMNLLKQLFGVLGKPNEYVDEVLGIKYAVTSKYIMIDGYEWKQSKVSIAKCIEELTQTQHVFTGLYKVIYIRYIDVLFDSHQTLRQLIEDTYNECRYIFTSRSIDNIDPSLVSRCITMRVPAPSIEILSNWIKEKFEIENDISELIAIHSQKNANLCYHMAALYKETGVVENMNYIFAKVIYDKVTSTSSLGEIHELAEKYFRCNAHLAPILREYLKLVPFEKRKQNLYYIELYVSRKSKSIFDLLYLLMGLTKTMNIEAE